MAMRHWKRNEDINAAVMQSPKVASRTVLHLVTGIGGFSGARIAKSDIGFEHCAGVSPHRPRLVLREARCSNRATDMLINHRNTDIPLSPISSVSKTRLSFYWTHHGDPIAAPIVKALLYKALDEFRSKYPLDVVHGEDAMISLPGYANFALEPEQSAKYSLVWRDAISAVEAMMLKMRMDGCYERSAAIFVANGILVGEMLLFKKGVELKRRREISKVDSSAAVSLLDSVTTTPAIERLVTEKPAAILAADNGNLSLRITHRGPSMDYHRLEKMFAAATKAARFSIRDGRGDKVANWRQLTWIEYHVRMSIWPHQGTRHLLTWKKVLDTLRLTLKILRQRPPGYRALDAEVVWVEAGEAEEVIGEIQVGVDKSLEKRNTTGTTALKTDLDNVNLRITTRGRQPPMPPRSVNTLLAEAMSTVLADIADGMGDEVVSLDHLSWRMDGIILRITPIRGVREPINYKVVYKVLDLMLERLQGRSYRPFDGDIITFGEGGRLSEYIGKVTIYEFMGNLVINTNDPLLLSTEELRLWNNTLTAGNLTTVALRTGEKNITLRYTYEGLSLNSVRLINLFVGAVGTVDDNVAAGKGDDPIEWKELKFHGRGMALTIVVYQRATYRLNWNMAVIALMLMVEHMKDSGYREYGADIVYNDEHGRMLEIIGEMNLVRRNENGTDTA